MRGREQFYQFSIFLNLLEQIIKVMPFCISESLWVLSEGWRSKVALAIRYAIVRNFAASCGQVIYIGPYVEIKNIHNLCIGSNVSIHRGCYIDAAGKIKIGNDVSIAHSTSILSTNHRWMDLNIPIRDNYAAFSPVVIEDDVWIGCGCRIMPGVCIKNRSIVAAGAVVTHDVKSGTIVGGVPARLIKHIPAPR